MQDDTENSVNTALGPASQANTALSTRPRAQSCPVSIENNDSFNTAPCDKGIKPPDGIIAIDYDMVLNFGSDNDRNKHEITPLSKEGMPHRFTYHHYVKIFLKLCDNLNLLAVLASQCSLEQKPGDDVAEEDHVGSLAPLREDMFYALDKVFGENRKHLTKAHAMSISEGLPPHKIANDKTKLLKKIANIKGCEECVKEGRVVLADDNKRIIDALKDTRFTGIWVPYNFDEILAGHDNDMNPEYHYQRNKFLIAALLTFKTPAEIMKAFARIPKTTEFNTFLQFFVRYIHEECYTENASNQMQLNEQLNLLKLTAAVHNSAPFDRDVTDYCETALSEMGTAENRGVLFSNTMKLTMALANPTPGRIRLARKSIQKDWGVRRNRVIYGAAVGLLASLTALCVGAVAFSILAAPLTFGATLGIAAAGIAGLAGLTGAATKLGIVDNNNKATLYDKSIKVLQSSDRVARYQEKRAQIYQNDEKVNTHLKEKEERAVKRKCKGKLPNPLALNQHRQFSKKSSCDKNKKYVPIDTGTVKPVDNRELRR